MAKPQSFWDKIWKDKTGKQAILEWPNIPLLAWIAGTIVAHFVPEGHINTGIEFIATAFLFTWAWLEIYSGRSYVRRLLGLVVFVAIISGRFKG